MIPAKSLLTTNLNPNRYGDDAKVALRSEMILLRFNLYA